MKMKKSWKQNKKVSIDIYNYLLLMWDEPNLYDNDAQALEYYQTAKQEVYETLKTNWIKVYYSIKTDLDYTFIDDWFTIDDEVEWEAFEEQAVNKQKNKWKKKKKWLDESYVMISEVKYL